MKKVVLTLVLIFTAIALQAQRNVDRTNFRAGVNGGLVIGDFSEAYSFGLGVDMYHHWGVAKPLDIGVTAGFFNAFGSKENISAGGLVVETEFDNIQFLPVGASIRIYPTSSAGFKIGSDVGYAVGINKGNKGAFYYRPSLGVDFSNGASELNISYLAVSDDVTFSSILLGYLILF